MATINCLLNPLNIIFCVQQKKETIWNDFWESFQSASLHLVCYLNSERHSLDQFKYIATKRFATNNHYPSFTQTGCYISICLFSLVHTSSARRVLGPWPDSSGHIELWCSCGNPLFGFLLFSVLLIKSVHKCQESASRGDLMLVTHLCRLCLDSDEWSAC